MMMTMLLFEKGNQAGNPSRHLLIVDLVVGRELVGLPDKAAAISDEGLKTGTKKIVDRFVVGQLSGLNSSFPFILASQIKPRPAL